MRDVTNGFGHESPNDVLDRIFVSHFDAVTGYALRRASPADAADVVAETMLIAWRRIDEVPAEPATRPWLLGVARRVLANRRRSDQRQSKLSERLARDLEVLRATVAPDPAEGTVEQVRLQAALSRLTADDRELILMSAWEGLSSSELALAFDIAPATARTRLHRARLRLRSEMNQSDAKERSASAGHFHCDGEDPVTLTPRGDS